MLFALLRRLRRPKGRRRRVRGVNSSRAMLLLLLYIIAIAAIHSAAMMAFEGMGPGDALWLTVTTLTTVGYGDISAASLQGRLSTAVLIYGGGIFVLAKAAGDYFDYRSERRHRMLTGRWSWDMQDHLLLINAPRLSPARYFTTLVSQLRNTDWGRDRGVLILAEGFPDGLPDTLADLGVFYVQGRGTDGEALASADAEDAAAIVVLAEDHHEAAADSITFDILHRLAALPGKAPILAESVDDQNRARLRTAGAGAVLRPMRGYPEMMVRAVVAPGSERILENLFDAAGDECVRYDLAVKGCTWGTLAGELLHKGIGTAIAFAEAGSGEINCNPRPDTVVDAEALFLIVYEGPRATAESLRQSVSEITA
ncbi:MAG: ion channel [Alphaproteobacteria bacterium]|nr:ion channel [Alphaproteobacteria bacterium]